MQIGFDLWGTLIKANPEFKERKRDLFIRHFPTTSINHCEEVMLGIKTELNNIIEDSGWQPPKEIIISLLATRLYQTKHSVENFLEDYQRLAIVYPPLFISDLTDDILFEISCKHSLIIVSNTMFIEGRTLRTILNNTSIGDYFSEMRFSDIESLSKPNRRILPSSDKLDYFIGDNLKTDGKFAETKKAEFIQINSTQKTLVDVHNIIIKK